ncbi:MAG: PAS domain S-box protein [Salinarimonadaceae bacterium]|nr:MAG: PAS domain S-box protein [Salinarimonadaceae bacterium]
MVSQARLFGVLDTAVDGIIVIDDHGRILLYNNACQRLFGYTAEEAIGQNVSMLMDMDHARTHDSYLSNYIRTGEARIIGIGREVSARARDGRVFPVELSVGEARTPGERQFVGILRDLTARKEAEQRLNDLQADLIRLARVSALDEMGSVLAHELNQPLTAIMLYLQAVAREFDRAREAGHTPQSDDRARTILDKARNEAQRAGQIIQRIRSLVEKRAPERRLISLNAIVDDAVDLTMLGQDRGVIVARDYHPELPEVEVDPVQIQQIVVNLVRNAYEVVREVKGGRIDISTACDARNVALTVSDNGPGIPDERRENLFQAFKTGKRNGMGLGLAISRTIAQTHGGDLTVYPGGEGRGAKFMIRLPLPTPDPAAGQADPPMVPQSGAPQR